MDRLLKLTLADGKQALGGKLKLALGTGLIVTGMVRTVLRHPLLVVTTRLTLYVPQPLKTWVGFCKVELFAAPLAGSPKFHTHPEMVPEAAGMVEVVLLNVTTDLSQDCAETVKLAEALSSTVIVLLKVSVQLPAVEVKVYLIE